MRWTAKRCLLPGAVDCRILRLVWRTAFLGQRFSLFLQTGFMISWHHRLQAAVFTWRLATLQTRKRLFSINYYVACKLETYWLFIGHLKLKLLKWVMFYSSCSTNKSTPLTPKSSLNNLRLKEPWPSPNSYPTRTPSLIPNTIPFH